MVAGLEAVLLVWIAAGPLFQVRHVEVFGNHRLQRPQVLSAAGLVQPVSVFAVDAATIRRKLTATPWVRQAAVTVALPDRVTVTLDEWQPVAVYQPAGGHALFLSDRAVVLGPAPDASAALEIDGPATPDPRVGARPVEPRLLTALVNIQRGLPGLISQDVKAFALDSCGDVTMTVQRGWRVLFGRVITPEEFAALDQKLAALKSIASKENLNDPNVEYVNLENAQLPAVGVKPPPAPTPKPSPGATAIPTPVPTPVSATPCR